MIKKKIVLLLSILTLIIFLNFPKYAYAQIPKYPDNVIKLELVSYNFSNENYYTYEYIVNYRLKDYYPQSVTHNDYFLFTNLYLSFKNPLDRGQNSYQLISYHKSSIDNYTTFQFRFTILKTYINDNYDSPYYIAPLIEQLNIYFKDEKTYQQGYNDGYNQGYLEGSENPNNYNFVDFISSIFSGIGTIFNINLLPGISIGAIVAVPIVFGVIDFILGKRGGK